MNEIKTYRDFLHNETPISRIRNFMRSASIAMMSINHDILATNNWIRFPYYHHVFDDEKINFERQLKYLKNFGEFISIDQVCDLVSISGRLSGRYFCLSFDDGYSNCYSNMMDITVNLDIPVIIYLPTEFIGLEIDSDKDIPILKKHLPNNPKLLSFLSWENCSEMLNNMVTFGSHTHTHARLSKLNDEEIELELKISKSIIELKLGVKCEHFACPWGRSGVDFNPEVSIPIAKKLGFKTFATTNRGKTQSDDNLFLLKRDHMIAHWENFQLKYFFGK